MCLCFSFFLCVCVCVLQPFEEWVPEQIHPLSNRPVPKRRFIPSKHEGKKIAHLVRLIRKGLLRPLPEKTDQDALPNAFEIWEGDAAGKLSAYHIPPPRLALPGDRFSALSPPPFLSVVRFLALLSHSL